MSAAAGDCLGLILHFNHCVLGHWRYVARASCSENPAGDASQENHGLGRTGERRDHGQHDQERAGKQQ